MPEFSFRTIIAPAEGQYKEKGSRFLSFAFPVGSEEEVKHHLSTLEKSYFDARHHCFAYILGSEGTKFRAFDAGEPNHSAGDPILGQIRSRDLTNVLVCVVRYFGGTKLGVGGLVNAYKLAAADALNNARIVEKHLTKTFTISYDYSGTAELMRLVNDFNLMIEDQSFQEICTLTASCYLTRVAAFREKLEVLKTLGHVRDFKER